MSNPRRPLDKLQIIRSLWDLNTSRWSIDLEDGTHLEGYPIDIVGEHIVFSLGGALAPREPILVEVNLICLDRLDAYCKNDSCWKRWRWNPSTKTFKTESIHR